MALFGFEDEEQTPSQVLASGRARSTGGTAGAALSGQVGVPAVRPMAANEFDAALSGAPTAGEDNGAFLARRNKLAALGVLGPSRLAPTARDAAADVKATGQVVEDLRTENDWAVRAADVEGRRVEREQEQALKQQERERVRAERAATAAATKAERGRVRWLKDQGVRTQVTPDGLEEPERHPDGAYKFKPEFVSEPYADPESGRYVRDFRDDRGTPRVVDLEANGDLHTDAQTGHRYARGADGLRIDLGPDKTFAERETLKGERAAFTRANEDDRLTLAELREKNKPTTTAWLEVEKKAKVVRGRADALAAMPGAEDLKRAAGTAWETMRPAYEAAKAAHDAATAGEQEITKRIRTRERSSLEIGAKLDRLARARWDGTPGAVTSIEGRLNEAGEKVQRELQEAQERYRSVATVPGAEPMRLGNAGEVERQRGAVRVKAESDLREAAARARALQEATRALGQDETAASAGTSPAVQSPAVTLSSVRREEQVLLAKRMEGEISREVYDREKNRIGAVTAKVTGELTAARETKRAAVERALALVEDPKTWEQSPERGVALGEIERAASEWSGSTGESELEGTIKALEKAGSVNPLVDGKRVDEELKRARAAFEARGLTLQGEPTVAEVRENEAAEGVAAESRVNTDRKKLAGELVEARSGAAKEFRWLGYGDGVTDGAGYIWDQGVKALWETTREKNRAVGFLKAIGTMGGMLVGPVITTTLGKTKADMLAEAAAESATRLIGSKLDPAGVEKMLEVMPGFQSRLARGEGILDAGDYQAAEKDGLKKVGMFEKWYRPVSLKLTLAGAEEAVLALRAGKTRSVDTFLENMLSTFPGVKAGEIAIDESDPVQVAKRAVLGEELQKLLREKAGVSSTAGSVVGSVATFLTLGAAGEATALKLGMTGPTGVLTAGGNLVRQGVTFGPMGADSSLKQAEADLGFLNRAASMGLETAMLGVSERLGDRLGAKLEGAAEKMVGGTGKIASAARAAGKTFGMGTGELSSDTMQNMMMGRPAFEDFQRSLGANYGMALGMSLITGAVRGRALGKGGAPVAGHFEGKLDALRGAQAALDAARQGGDAVGIAQAKDAVTSAAAAVQAASGELLRVPSAVRSRLSAVMGADTRAVSQALEENPTLRIAAVAIGQEMRDVYLPGPRSDAARKLARNAEGFEGEAGVPLADAVVDQMVGGLAARDLADVASGTGNVAADKLAAFERLGLVEIRTANDGGIQAVVTEDGLALLPAALRSAVSATPAKYRVTGTGGAGQFANALVKQGEEILGVGARTMTAAQVRAVREILQPQQTAQGAPNAGGQTAQGAGTAKGAENGEGAKVAGSARWLVTVERTHKTKGRLSPVTLQIEAASAEEAGKQAKARVERSGDQVGTMQVEPADGGSAATAEGEQGSSSEQTAAAENEKKLPEPNAAKSSGGTLKASPILAGTRERLKALGVTVADTGESTRVVVAADGGLTLLWNAAQTGADARLLREEMVHLASLVAKRAEWLRLGESKPAFDAWVLEDSKAIAKGLRAAVSALRGPDRAALEEALRAAWNVYRQSFTAGTEAADLAAVWADVESSGGRAYGFVFEAARMAVELRQAGEVREEGLTRFVAALAEWVRGALSALRRLGGALPKGGFADLVRGTEREYAAEFAPMLRGDFSAAKAAAQAPPKPSKERSKPTSEKAPGAEAKGGGAERGKDPAQPGAKTPRDPGGGEKNASGSDSGKSAVEQSKTLDDRLKELQVSKARRGKVTEAQRAEFGALPKGNKAQLDWILKKFFNLPKLAATKEAGKQTSAEKPQGSEAAAAGTAESSATQPDGVSEAESKTAEDLSGEKINRSWTAFAEDAGGLGIARTEMPQVQAAHRGALANFLRARGIEWTNEEVLPGTLKPTQREYSPAKVEKARTFDQPSRAILVSADNHVVDGHHQWMAALDKAGEAMPVVRLQAPIRDILREMAQFPSAGMEGAVPVEAKPARTFKRKAAFDGFGEESTPVSAALMGMGGVLSQRTAKERGKLERNADLWDDKPSLAHPTHNKVYSKSGLMPDAAAQGLYDMGLLREPTASALWAAIAKESRTAFTERTEARTMAAQAEKQEQRTEAFESARNNPAGGEAIPVADLKVGDRVQVGTELMRVTAVDADTFDVTIEDGAKFGVQQVADGEVIYGEILTTEGTALQGKVPKLRAKETGTGDLFQGGDQPFNLAGETGVDGDRVVREKAQREREAAEAKAKADREQGMLFGKQVRDAVVVPFYSQLARVVEEKVQGAVTAEQLKATLTGKVKADEMEWVLGDLLARKAGQKITRQELLDEIATNRVQVVEVEKNPDGLNAPMRERLRQLEAREEEGTLTEEQEWQLNDLRMESDEENARTSKYHEYQLPGGENYRELLLTLPVNETKRFDDLAREEFGIPFNELSQERQNMVRGMARGRASENGDWGKNVYRSNHWDEANILAHARVNERTTSDGRSMLFAEELQSDWHQEGRKKGYEDSKKVAAMKELGAEERRLSDVLVALRREGKSDTAEYQKILEASRANTAQIMALNASGGTAGVPNAPFKGEGWKRLGLRKLIAKAIEAGKEAIGWTTGAQQADRYDLSKQLDSVEVRKIDGSNRVTVYASKDNQNVITKQTTIENLPDVIGKELAQKVANDLKTSNSSVSSGLDLQVGGEGMKGFYDRELVSIANEIGKRFGAKVERASVPLTTPKFSEWLSTNYGPAAELTQGEIDGARIEYREEFPKEKAEETAEVWVLRISPAMREKVAGEGLALFGKLAPAPLQRSLVGDLPALDRDKIGREAALMGRGFDGAQIDEETEATREGREAAGTPEPLPKGAFRDFVGGVYQRFLRGRKDALEHYAPGTKAVLADSEQESAFVRAGMRELTERMQADMRTALGQSAGGKKRTRAFVDELLPTAARLNPVGYDSLGNFVFSDFQMRAGTLGRKTAEKSGVTTGQLWVERGEFLIVGEYLEEQKAFQLLRPMSALRQAAIYEGFHQKWDTVNPETGMPVGHWLDSFIAPDKADARVIDTRGTVLPDFNRHALRDFFGEAGQGELSEVKGYVPEVARNRSAASLMASAVSNLLSRGWTSGAREYKSGDARERGQVRDLLQGFAIRGMEAHAETQRLRTAEKLIALTLKDVPPTGVPEGYVAFNAATMTALGDAWGQAHGLTKEQLTSLTLALARGDEAEMRAIVGKAWASLRADKMVRREVLAEIVRPMAAREARNTALRVVNSIVRSYTASLLSHPFSWIQNQLSNELFKLMRITQQTVQGVMLLPFTRAGAKRSFREAGYLMRGMVNDRWWNEAKLNEVVPPELFEGNTSIAGAATSMTEEDKTVMEHLKQVNIPAALLKFARYGKMDVRAKQQLAYAAYMASAETAADAAQKKGFVFANRKQRVAWMKRWLAEEVTPEVHRRAKAVAVAYAMDYSNVPAWMDNETQVKIAGRDLTAAANMARALTLPFIKWPYNMARQMKRFAGGSAADVLAWTALRGMQALPVSVQNTKAVAALRGLASARTVSPARFAAGVGHLTTFGLLLAVTHALFGDDKEDKDKLGRSFDQAGKRLDAAYDTSSRVEISDVPLVGPAVKALAKMFGERTEDQGYWLRVRTLPYAPIMLTLSAGLSAVGSGEAGRGEEAKANLREFFADFMSKGIALNMYNALSGTESKYDAGKSLGTILGQNATDVALARLAPAPWLATVRDLIDPVPRRQRPSAALEFEPGFMEGMQSRIPGWSAGLPPAGTVKTKRVENAVTDLAALEAKGLAKTGSRLRVSEETGKPVASYVDPAALGGSARMKAVARLFGANVKSVPKDEYRRAVAGEETEFKKVMRRLKAK